MWNIITGLLCTAAHEHGLCARMSRLDLIIAIDQVGVLYCLLNLHPNRVRTKTRKKENYSTDTGWEWGCCVLLRSGCRPPSSTKTCGVTCVNRYVLYLCTWGIYRHPRPTAVPITSIRQSLDTAVPVPQVTDAFFACYHLVYDNRPLRHPARGSWRYHNPWKWSQTWGRAITLSVI